MEKPKYPTTPRFLPPLTPEKQLRERIKRKTVRVPPAPEMDADLSIDDLPSTPGTFTPFSSSTSEETVSTPPIPRSRTHSGESNVSTYTPPDILDAELKRNQLEEKELRKRLEALQEKQLGIIEQKIEHMNQQYTDGMIQHSELVDNLQPLYLEQTDIIQEKLNRFQKELANHPTHEERSMIKEQLALLQEKQIKLVHEILQHINDEYPEIENKIADLQEEMWGSERAREDQTTLMKKLDKLSAIRENIAQFKQRIPVAMRKVGGKKLPRP